ncbi:MAG: septum formation initiator family protein [Bacteroidales bacterium]|nr:septum formation initiator family protein [Bacteroidales bacterium]
MKNDIRKSLAPLSRNKYVISVFIFVLWLFLIAEDDILTRLSLSASVKSLTEQKEQLKAEIEEDYRKMEELRNVETLEKFAREEYYMKAPDEVVFIVK